MAKQFPIKQVEEHFRKVLLYAPGMMANDARNFFLDRFKEQAWLGDSRQPWKPRKAVTKWGPTKRNNGRAILVLDGILRNSIRITQVGSLQATIATNVPYARAHNEGLRAGFIQKVKQYERRKTVFGVSYKKELKTRTKIKFGRVETGKVTVKAHSRRVNMVLPRRQFMGQSPYLTKMLTRRLQSELMKGLRNL